MDELAYMAAKAGVPEMLARDAAAESSIASHEVWARERFHLPISKATLVIKVLGAFQAPLIQPRQA